jgi:hypothetical protein
MNETTEKKGGAGDKDVGVGSPKKGDRFRCGKCGMEVQVTADCGCNQANMVHFHCCGQELTKA